MMGERDLVLKKGRYRVFILSSRENVIPTEPKVRTPRTHKNIGKVESEINETYYNTAMEMFGVEFDFVVG